MNKEQNKPLVIELEPKLVALLRACAAFDDVTPEQFAVDAIKNNMAGAVDGIRSELEN